MEKQAMMSMRRPLLSFFLLLVLISSTDAGKLKGFKKSTPPEDGGAERTPNMNSQTKATRNLKKEGKSKGPLKRACKAIKEAKGPLSLVKPAIGWTCVADKLIGRELGVSLTTVEGDNKLSNNVDLTPSNEAKDEIKYLIDTSEKGIQVSIQYTRGVDEDESSSTTGKEFELHFDSLIEYIKEEESQELEAIDMAYEWMKDTIVQQIPLDMWDRSSGIVSGEDGVSYFTVKATLATSNDANEPTGTTQFNFTISETKVGQQMTPNSMKIDVEIIDFPWQRSDSYIALITSVNSSKLVQLSYNSEAYATTKENPIQDISIDFEEEIQELGLEVFGDISWATDADEIKQDSPLAGGEPTGTPESQVSAPIKVVATSNMVAVTGNHHDVAYSFVGAQGGRDISWKTGAGVEYYEITETLGFERDDDGKEEGILTFGVEEAKEDSAASASQSITGAAVLFVALLLGVK